MHAIFNQLENSRAYTMNWFDKSDGHKSLGPGQLPPILSGAREFLGAMIMEGLAGAGGGGRRREGGCQLYCCVLRNVASDRLNEVLLCSQRCRTNNLLESFQPK